MTISLRIFLAACVVFIIGACGSNGQTGNKLSVDEFEKAIAGKDVQLIDVRTTGEYSQGHIQGAALADWNSDDFDQRVAWLDKSKPVYVYCLSGGRSASAATHLRDKGYDVIEMPAGMMGWRNAKKPEVTDKTTAANSTRSMTQDEFDHLLKTDKIVLIDFYAPWCAPCKKMEPFLNELSTELASTVKIVRINADDNAALVEKLQVQALPTLIVYKNGSPAWRYTGFVSKEDLRKQLK